MPGDAPAMEPVVLRHAAGELLAAIFGYHYFSTVRRSIDFGDVVADFVRMLERAVILTYLKNNPELCHFYR